MNNTSNAIMAGNIVRFPELRVIEKKEAKTASPYKSDGVPKAKPADPIRNVDDIVRIQKYYLENNQLRNYTIFTLGVTFGIRAGDLCALRVRDVLTTCKGIKEYCDIYEDKTNKYNRPYITGVAREALERYIPTLKDTSPEAYLFPSKKRAKDGSRKPLSIQQLGNILREPTAKLSIRGHISTHSLRKTFVYHLIRQNDGDNEAQMAVQYMMNHESFKTTLRYCGITQEKADTMRDTFAQALM